MSEFDGSLGRVRMAVTYFNRLPNVDKVTIVSDLSPKTFKRDTHLSLSPLLSWVQKSLPKHDGVKIGNKLMELGLDETYARLIVSNMKRDAPTIKYHISQIGMIKDDAFSQMEKIANSIWVDHDGESAIVEKYGISQEQYGALVKLMSYVLNKLHRGDVAEKEIARTLVKNGLSRPRSEAMLRTIQTHKDGWHARMMFRNVQDALAYAKKVEKQNEKILSGIEEITRLLRARAL